MSKYLFQASLSREGVMGTLKEGGTSRMEEIGREIENLGGTMEVFYYAFGATDAYVIADLPDDATAAAMAMAVSGSGAGSVTTTVLLEPSAIDDAAAKTVHYRPPGS